MDLVRQMNNPLRLAWMLTIPAQMRLPLMTIEDLLSGQGAPVLSRLRFREKTRS